MRYLAIDLGTTFLKGAVLDLEHRELLQIERVPMPNKLPNPEPLLHELDPESVVNAVRKLIANLRTVAPDAKGLVMCAQMHGMVLLGKDRQALTPIITWQDQRARLPHPSGEGSCLEWASHRLSEQDLQQLGNEVRPGLPNVTLPWFDAKRLRGALVVSLPDFVLSRLSGDEPVVEATNAAAYGLLDLRTGHWHGDVIDQLGLSHLRFPEIIDYRAVAYVLDGMPCYPPIGDHQAALLGSALRPNELSINIATGSQISLLNRSFQAGDIQTRPFFDGWFLNTNAQVPAGRSLNVLLGLVTELGCPSDPWQLIEDAVAKTAGTDLEIDLSFFQSSDRDHGCIEGIREDNLTVGNLFRAAFGAMASEFHQCAQQLPGIANCTQLVFSGGLAQKQKALRALITQRFALPARVCEHAEDTLIGLMSLARNPARGVVLSDDDEDVWLGVKCENERARD